MNSTGGYTNAYRSKVTMHADTLENIINAMNNLKYDEDTIDYASIDGCQEADHNNTIDMCIKIVKDMLSESDLISKKDILKLQYCIDDSATLSTRYVINVEDVEDM